ncbi:MAG: hypothetical protein EPO42_07300 [Gallionellaceae bacterium]|nr:MAG: hypothetical protein EPO42_07300 [Gallionellaceae bacterium]
MMRLQKLKLTDSSGNTSCSPLCGRSGFNPTSRAKARPAEELHKCSQECSDTRIGGGPFATHPHPNPPLEREGVWANGLSRIVSGFRLGLVVVLAGVLTACGGGAGSASGGGDVSIRAASLVSPASASATPATTLPAAPNVISITSGNGEITLTWGDVPGATSYNVYYLTYPGVRTSNARQLVGAVSGNPITGLTNTQAYYFAVTAVNAAGESVASSEVTAMPMPALPGIPGNVRLVGGFAEATLDWQVVPYATSYNVYYGISPGLPNATSTVITGVRIPAQLITGLNKAPGRYYFRVTAVDASGEGSPSVELAAIAQGTFKLVSGGYGHSAVVRSLEPALGGIAGTVWTWGDNSRGQLGDSSSKLGKPNDSFTQRLTTAEISYVDRVSAIASGYHHTAVLLTDRTIKTWGMNTNGQLGANGQLLTHSLSQPATNTDFPRSVSLAPPAMTAIAAGFQHTVALKDDGTVWAWGYNVLGTLGYASMDCANPVYGQFFWTCSDVPTQLTGITGSVAAIAGGYSHTLAVTSDGQVWAWGRNDTGQLGTLAANCNRSITQMLPSILQAQALDTVFDPATQACNTTPTPVNAIPGSIVAVSAGMRHSLALMSDGTVWAWGGNYYGQLGYTPAVNLFTNSDTCVVTTALTMPCSYDPKPVLGLDHVVAISAGTQHNLALKGDGTVWAWGYNAMGQLGTGAAAGFVYNQTPKQVPGLTGIISIAAGAYHSLAVKNDGTVWAWGDNTQGQLGDGSKTNRSSPVQVQGLRWPVVIIPGR